MFYDIYYACIRAFCPYSCHWLLCLIPLQHLFFFLLELCLFCFLLAGRLTKSFCSFFLSSAVITKTTSSLTTKIPSKKNSSALAVSSSDRGLRCQERRPISVTPTISGMGICIFRTLCHRSSTRSTLPPAHPHTYSPSTPPSLPPPPHCYHSSYYCLYFSHHHRHHCSITTINTTTTTTTRIVITKTTATRTIYELHLPPSPYPCFSSCSESTSSLPTPYCQ